MKHITKKRGKFQTFLFISGSLSLLNPSVKLGSFKVGKNLACLRSNLFAQSNPKTIEKLRHLTKGNKEFLEPKGYHEEEKFNSLDDCIYGIEEPLYSAAVRVYEEGPTDCVLEGTPKDYGNKYLPNCPADAPVLNGEIFFSSMFHFCFGDGFS